MDKILKLINNNLYALSLYARQIAGTLILFVIARYLLVYDFGLFSSYRNIAVFCLMFANLGYADYILVSSKANTKEVKLKIALFMQNAIILSFLYIICSLFFKLESHLLFALIIIRTFFDTTFFGLILPFFQSEKKFLQIAVINIIYAVFITLIAGISYTLKLSLIKFLLLNILLGSINFIQCSYYAKINYLIVFKYFHKIFKMLDKEIFSYIGVTIAFYLYAQIPSLFVSLTQKKENAAIYFAAFTIASVVGLLITAQSQKMVPDMINASAIKIKIIIKENLKFILRITTLLFLLFVLLGKQILLLLYGQNYYANAYFILLILMLGNICVAIAAVFGTYITASGNQRKKIPMQLKATFCTILGITIFYKFGIYAAVIAYLFASIYTAFQYTIFTLQELRNKKGEY